MTTTRALTTWLLSLLIIPLTGQVNDSVTVIKQAQFEPKQYELEIDHQPSENKTIPDLNPQYETSVPLEDIDKPKLSLRALKYEEERVKSGHDGLIKLGFGTPGAAEAKLLYNYHIEDWYHIGLKGGYQGAEDFERNLSKYTDWHAGIYGGYQILDKLKARFDTDFSRARMSVDRSDMPEIWTRNYTFFDALMGFNFNSFADHGFLTDVQLDYQNNAVSTRQNDGQNVLNFNGHISQRILKNLAVNLDLIHERVKTESWDEGVNYTQIRPILSFKNQLWYLAGGLNYNTINDASIYWPEIQTKYALTDYHAMIGVHMTLQTNYYSEQEIYLQNRYESMSTYQPQPLEFTTRRSVSVFGEIERKQSKFGLKYAYTLVDNGIEFERYKQSLIGIDGGFDYRVNQRDYRTHTIVGNIAYYPLDWLEAKLNAETNIYNATIGFLPILRIDLKLIQRLRESRFYFFQSVQYIHRNSYSNNGFYESLDDILELSAGIEVRVLNNFKLYVRGSNLGMQDYAIWPQYPVFRPMALGGFIYSIDTNN